MSLYESVTPELNVRQLHYDREKNTLAGDMSDTGTRVIHHYLTVRGKTRTVNYEFHRHEYTGRGEDREIAAYIYKPLNHGDPTLRLFND